MVPRLPALAGVDRIEQIGARMPDVLVARRAQVGKRDSLGGRLAQREVAT